MFCLSKFRTVAHFPPFARFLSHRSTMSAHPTAVLYTFEGSVWASVPTLLLSEKKLGPEHCQVRSVDLFSGANFSPSYLKISPKG